MLRTFRWKAGALALMMLGVLLLSGCLGRGSPVPSDKIVLLSYGKSYEYTGKGYSTKYPDEDMNKLTNGLTGEAVVSDPQWVGFVATAPIKVKIDLEETFLITEMRSHHYAADVGGVSYPAFIRIRASEDGGEWSDPVEYETKVTPPTDPVTDWFVMEDLELVGRYIEVEFEWNESAGKSNIFVSEIELYGKKEQESEPA